MRSDSLLICGNNEFVLRFSHSEEVIKEKKDMSAFSFMKYSKIIVHPALAYS